MNDTSGPTSGTPLAQYDPDTQCWKTSEATSLWALTLSSLTLPTWGGLHAGVLYELPTPERPTIEPGYSSLPTPTTRDYKDATFSPRVMDGRSHGELPQAIGLQFLPTPVADNSRGLHNGGNYQSLPNTVLTLPTPTAQAAKHITMDDRGVGTHDDHNLWSVASRLLPTPAVNDMGAGKDPQAWDEWAARQKAADGRPAPHGKSLEQEALRMLPTPVSSDATHSGPNQRDSSGRLSLTATAVRVGVTTHQPSTAGSTSSDALHQAPLFSEQDETA